MNLTNLTLDSLWTFLDACTANPLLKSKIEAELQHRIPPTKKFSREYLYSVNIVGKKALIIYFIPATDSFEQYGRKIVVNMVLDDETKEALSKNYASKPTVRSHGKVKADSLIIEGITEEQRKLLKTQGFNTEDIMLVEWE
ncbi:MAG: hypothetical protein ACXWEY_16655 [Bacteroidia bacterium]